MNEYPIVGIGGVRDSNAEAEEVRFVAEGGAELSERASELRVRHHVASVSQHFQNGAPRQVVPESLRAPFIHVARYAISSPSSSSSAAAAANDAAIAVGTTILGHLLSLSLSLSLCLLEGIEEERSE